MHKAESSVARPATDLRWLLPQCQHHGIPFPLGATHLNVKRLVALSARWDREEGMAGAMRRLGVEPLPGSRHHRGCDDAVEIARLLGRVLGGVRG